MFNKGNNMLKNKFFLVFSLIVLIIPFIIYRPIYFMYGIGLFFIFSAFNIYSYCKNDDVEKFKTGLILYGIGYAGCLINLFVRFYGIYY